MISLRNSGSIAQKGQYSVVRVRVPQEENIQTVGVLLVDDDDRLYYRLSDVILSNEEHVLTVWQSTSQMIDALAEELGGTGVLHLLENNGSHFLEISSPTPVEMADPNAELLNLYDRHVTALHLQSRFEGPHRIGRSAIEISCSSMPSVSTDCIDLLRRYKRRELELEHLERLLEHNPIASGQIVRLANITVYARGTEVRSIRQALLRVGTEAAFGLIMALAFRPLYSSPGSRAIWNLALRCRGAAVALAGKLDLRNVEEIGLLALMADIGKIVLFNVPGFENNYASLRASGYAPLVCERILTGTTHAEISATMLESWSFPEDMTDAVRFHHTPSESSAVSPALLYLSECSVECDDVECDLNQYRAAGERLQPSTRLFLDSITRSLTAPKGDISGLLAL